MSHEWHLSGIRTPRDSLKELHKYNKAGSAERLKTFDKLMIRKIIFTAIYHLIDSKTFFLSYGAFCGPRFQLTSTLFKNNFSKYSFSRILIVDGNLIINYNMMITCVKIETAHGQNKQLNDDNHQRKFIRPAPQHDPSPFQTQKKQNKKKYEKSRSILHFMFDEGKRKNYIMLTITLVQSCFFFSLSVGCPCQTELLIN